MSGMPVPVADDFEWARAQAKAQYDEYQKRKLNNTIEFIFPESWICEKDMFEEYRVVRDPYLRDGQWVVEVEPIDETD